MRPVGGLHHVTAISGPAQENLDFYVGILGLRLVKRSVNQDDPGVYHLFYADAEGHPGTELTFFPWQDMPPGRLGAGLSVEVALAVPPGALAYWQERLHRYGVATEAPQERFGERELPFSDPHGLRLALVEAASVAERPFNPWLESPVPAAWQIRGLHAARIWVRTLEPTARLLVEGFGFERSASDGAWMRFRSPEDPAGGYLDVQVRPEAASGRWGVGTVHHLAWRVVDAAHQEAVRERLLLSGLSPTPPIDRFWFRSVYFREPGGVLFELATDGPGFAIDEDPDHLGERLILPPWLEPRRKWIESLLPPLRYPPAEVAP
ncbi:MAG: ring-cleaving dioxygenase [Bacteroidetes bacterium]|nr:ring-cleaving dioxygenase [Rhodothermia bacterium]MCS7155783.1 ring-cleaving dioxygenase [Bacteroidota bacterium]MCX7906116.1 ring-cleaving dioxygenase [Bacteroidota bacterium]MDW8138244.1 ring-cleaving dioxygenase [Bacteroidota bacterium]MDW8285928.1 ring-cleaving dioxygenase [Bacteroidota bacterium]